MHGDLGKSLLSSAPVTEPDRATACRTRILIATYALIIAALVGIPLGVLAATRVGSRLDAFVTSVRLARRRAAELLAGDPAGGVSSRST